VGTALPTTKNEVPNSNALCVTCELKKVEEG